MGFRIEYSAGSCFLFGLLCLVLPLKWLMGAVFAAVFHELCHILAVLVLGGQIRSMKIHFSGVVLNATPMAPWKNLICILAGPMGSIMLLLLAKYAPTAAFCGLVQGCFNLLPIYPLDGGRAIGCLLQMFISREAEERILSALQIVSSGLVFIAGSIGTFILKLGIIPLGVSILFLSGTLREKYLAKKANSQYNRLTI